MLTIRQAQLDAIAAARWDSFAARSIAEVREAHPARTGGVSDAELRSVFNAAAERAGGFDLRTETQITALFEATILLGERFEHEAEHGWALDVLTSRYLTPDDRATLVLAKAKALRAPRPANKTDADATRRTRTRATDESVTIRRPRQDG